MRQCYQILSSSGLVSISLWCISYIRCQFILPHKGLYPKVIQVLALHVRFHYFGLIHLISLNKYVVHKIINQGLSCLTYFMIVSKLITLCSNRSQGIIPLAISILCYANKDLCGVNKMQFVQVSSIFRCYIRFVSKQGYSLLGRILSTYRYVTFSDKERYFHAAQKSQPSAHLMQPRASISCNLRFLKQLVGYILFQRRKSLHISCT